MIYIFFICCHHWWKKNQTKCPEKLHLPIGVRYCQNSEKMRRGHIIKIYFGSTIELIRGHLCCIWDDTTLRASQSLVSARHLLHVQGAGPISLLLYAWAHLLRAYGRKTFGFAAVTMLTKIVCAFWKCQLEWKGTLPFRNCVTMMPRGSQFSCVSLHSRLESYILTSGPLPLWLMGNARWVHNILWPKNSTIVS